MSAFLDWALAEGDVDQQAEWTKAEICLLASFVDPNHAVLDELTFTTTLYQGAAHLFIPLKFAAPLGTDFGDAYESEYIESMITSGVFSTVYTEENVLYGMHDVYFDTNFGKNKKTNTYYVDWIKTHYPTNYWIDDESISSFFNTIDLTLEAGIALKCLNDDISVEDKNYIDTLDYFSPSWNNYHPFLVKEIYEAMV